MTKNYLAVLLIAVLMSFTTNAQLTVLSEDFNAGIGTFTAVDVLDPTDVWTPNAGVMEMNGFGGADDEDWLISPAVDLDAQLDEYLIFDYNDVFNGPLIELYYSTDYNGGGTVTDLQGATWTSLSLDVLDIAATSCFSTLYHPHRAIDISGISGTNVYFAFKYTTAAGAAKQYRIDNFRILAEYYGSVHTYLNAGGSCEGLMNEVHETIKTQQTVIQYTSSNYDLWDALLITDRRLNDAGTAEIVWDMFTDIPSGTGEFEYDHCTNRDNGSCPGGEGNCYNREHTFPRSWWGGTTAYPTDTFNFDLHHVTPSDRQMNTYKLNYPPGVVTTPVNTGSNGVKIGFNPSYPCSSMQYFEPIDEYKGDYARMYLYFITRYKSHVAGWFGNSLQGDCAMDGADYPGYAPWLMDVLLTWHASDPVSQKEIDRNNVIYSLQGNRNPFIDNPDWVGFVWGDALGNSCSDLVSACTPTNGSENVTVCDTYTWSANATTYNTSGVYTAILTNAEGCDSTATLNLTVNTTAPPAVTVQNNCGFSVLTATGTNIMWSTGETTPSITVTAGGTYTVNQTENNCVSADASVVAVPLQSSTSTTTLTSCDNYTWTDGNTYSASGIYTQTLVNANGCDSIATLDLTISTFSASTDIVTACDSYTWIDGNTYTASNNSATWTVLASNGCDSIITLDLTLNNSSAGTDVITACNSYTWIDGNTYTSSNNAATFTLTNMNGCDSLVTLDLTINSANPPIVTVQNDCGSSTLTAAGSNLMWSTGETTPSITVTNGGIYTVNQTVNGCLSADASVQADPLTSTSSTTTLTECDSYTWTDGNTYASTGSYSQTLTNAAGCDSIATLDLTINASTTSSLIETALDSYSLNGQVYTQSGVYTQVLTNAAGCDSTITLNLTVEYTGVEEQELNVGVYPNPFTDELHIISEGNLNGEFDILDSKGRVVYNGELKESDNISLANLSKGVYYLSFKEHPIRVRIVKQ